MSISNRIPGGRYSALCIPNSAFRSAPDFGNVGIGAHGCRMRNGSLQNAGPTRQLWNEINNDYTDGHGFLRGSKTQDGHHK
jgi:hypothetical protein